MNPEYRGVPVTPKHPPDAVRFDETRRLELSRLVVSGDLQRRRRGIYVPTAPEADGVIGGEHEALAEIRAVFERLTTEYVFSHTSAALLHGCWTWRLSPEVHVSQPSAPKAGKYADPRLRRHCVEVPADERTTVVALPVTTLERTVVDCAAALPPMGGIVIADSAVRAGAARTELERIVDARAHTPGIRRARRVVAAADGTSESPGESLVRWIVVDGGLPAPSTQIKVDTWRGPKWIDLGWRDIKVGIEFDGAVKYGSGDDLMAEKQRHDAIVEAGWTLIRVTWPDFTKPNLLLRRIRELLQTRALNSDLR